MILITKKWETCTETVSFKIPVLAEVKCVFTYPGAFLFFLFYGRIGGMETLNNNDERSPLTKDYLAEIKIRVWNGGKDDKTREEELSRVINELEWYMRLRKSLEDGDMNDFYNETSEIEKRKRYTEISRDYGTVQPGGLPKFSMRELEFFVQDVKGLAKTIFSNPNQGL